MQTKVHSLGVLSILQRKRISSYLNPFKVISWYALYIGFQ